MQFSNHVHTYNVNFVETLKVTFALAVWGDTTATTYRQTHRHTMLQNFFKCGNLGKKNISFPLH